MLSKLSCTSIDDYDYDKMCEMNGKIKWISIFIWVKLKDCGIGFVKSRMKYYYI